MMNPFDPFSGIGGIQLEQSRERNGGLSIVFAVLPPDPLLRSASSPDVGFMGHSARLYQERYAIASFASFEHLNISCVFVAAKRYCSMLFHEEGDQLLRSIAAHNSAVPKVRQFCLSILQLLQQEGLLRDDVNMTMSYSFLPPADSY
jgi:hypothetical protein